MELFERLAVALALGLLIGLERGWHLREAGEGNRIAGVRTFGLIGLLGGLVALPTQPGEGPGLLLPVAFAGLALLVIAIQLFRARESQDYGITTAVAALLTFILGATTMRGHMEIAGAVAVVAIVLLGLKPQLHGGVRKLERRELYALFNILLMSVVLLPILPDRGYGPWQALNPYEIWWMVVLIAGISFAGYFAVRIAGQRRGLLMTGIFGGLASSTAVTLSFARLGRKDSGAHALLAIGVILAAGTMFPRMLVAVFVVERSLLPALMLPMLGMMLISYAGAALLYHGAGRGSSPEDVSISNPLEVIPALKFGLLLIVVILLTELFRRWFDDVGIYVAAALSGITDVNAITLSLARMVGDDLTARVAVQGMVIAACVNTLVKAVLVAVLAGAGRMSYQVGAVLLVTILAGVAFVWFDPLVSLP